MSKKAQWINNHCGKCIYHVTESETAQRFPGGQCRRKPPGTFGYISKEPRSSRIATNPAAGEGREVVTIMAVYPQVESDHPACAEYEADKKPEDGRTTY